MMLLAHVGWVPIAYALAGLSGIAVSWYLARAAPLGRRLVAAAVSATLLLAGWVLAGWVVTREDARMRSQLLRTAQHMSASVSPDAARQIKFTAEDRDNPFYARFTDLMREAVNLTGVRAMFSVGRRGDRFYFGPESYLPGDPEASSPGDVYQSPPPELRKVFDDRQSAVVGPYRDEFGEFITAFVPIVDSRSGQPGLVVGIDFPPDRWALELTRSRDWVLLFWFVLLAILVVGHHLALWRPARYARGWVINARRREGALVTLVGLWLTAGLAGFAYHEDQHGRHQTLLQVTESQGNHVAGVLVSLRDDLRDLAQYMVLHATPTAQDFAEFARPLVSKYAVMSIAYVRNEGGVRFPITFVEPVNAKNEALIGVDQAGEPVRRAVFTRALVTGLPMISDPVALMQDGQQPETALIAVIPVVDAGVTKGFATVAFRVTDLLQANVVEPFGAERSVSLALHLRDPDGGMRLLGALPPDTVAEAPGDWSVFTNELVDRYPVLVFGRAFAVVLRPRSSFLEALATGTTWLIVASAGVLVTLFAALFAVSLASRRAALEEQVETRTRELRHSETRLREALDTLHLATEAAAIGVWTWDFDTGRLEWDEAMCKMYGVSPESGQAEFYYQTWSARLHADDRARVEAEIDRCRKTGQPWNDEFRIVRDDGRVRHIQAASVVDRDDAGHVRRMIGINRDVTAVRETERAAVDAARNAQFRTLFAQAPVALGFLRKNRLEFINQQFTEMFGYAVEDVPTLADWWRVAYPEPAYQAEVAKRWDAAVEAARSNGGRIVPAEYRVTRRDGAERTMLIGGQLLDDGLLATFTDVTPLKEAAAETARARDAAEKANQIKSAFLANMSHEMRTPMNAILGLSHVALQAEPARREEYLRKIHAAGQQLMRLISDVLDFSKIEAGGLVLNRAEFDPAALLSSTLALVSATAEEKGLVVSTVAAPEVPRRVLGDGARIGQVLYNFTSNAVKFTAAGSVRLAVQVREASGGEVKLRFEVRDTGIGIAPAHLADVFSSFQQIDMSTTRKYGGTGLGLAIAKRLATLMGGEVGVESELGKGSTFWLDVTVRAAEAPAEPAGAPGAAPAAEGARVLVVDDTEINREIVVALLADLGMNVDMAADGAEAVTKAKAQAYDLVLMDLRMPEMDGFAAARAIHAEPRLAALPIVAVTADADEEDRAASEAAGMCDLIVKPIEPDELAARLPGWLAGRRAPAADPARAAEAARRLVELLAAADFAVGAFLDEHDALLAAAYPAAYPAVRAAARAFEYEKARELAAAFAPSA